jgi:hypothetical protein
MFAVERVVSQTQNHTLPRDSDVDAICLAMDSVTLNIMLRQTLTLERPSWQETVGFLSFKN